MSKDIIRMAREAGGYPAATTDRALLLFSESHLERFAELVRADERDRATRENAYVQAEREACINAVWQYPGISLNDRLTAITSIKARGTK